MAADLHPPRHFIPRILITPGEPAGIGPELLVRLAANNFPAQLLVVGDPQQLTATAQQMEIPLSLATRESGCSSTATPTGTP